MDYTKRQEANIRHIASGHQDWYKATKDVWARRYMEEKAGILTQKRAKRELDIIKKNLPQDCRKILDAPCGYGRLSNSLAASGYEVTGIDISEYFINIAETRAKKEKLSISYVVGDILKRKVAGKFDAVINIFSSLGYLKDEKKNELFIKRLCEYVKPGGRLIIEIVNPIALTKNIKRMKFLR